MSEKFYAMQSEVLDAKKPAMGEVEPTTLYLVAAWMPPDARVKGYWKIHRESNLDEFTTLEAAERRAAQLGPRWQHRKIIKVVLEV